MLNGYQVTQAIVMYSSNLLSVLIELSLTRLTTAEDRHGHQIRQTTTTLSLYIRSFTNLMRHETWQGFIRSFIPKSSNFRKGFLDTSFFTRGLKHKVCA